MGLCQLEGQTTEIPHGRIGCTTDRFRDVLDDARILSDPFKASHRNAFDAQLPFRQSSTEQRIEDVHLGRQNRQSFAQTHLERIEMQKTDNDRSAELFSETDAYPFVVGEKRSPVHESAPKSQQTEIRVRFERGRRLP